MSHCPFVGPWNMDCHMKENLETYLKLSSFTLEQKKLEQFLLGVFIL